MPSTYSYTAIQNAVTGLNYILFADTSVLEGETLTERRIFLLLDDGSYLVPAGITTDYIVWAANLNTLLVDVLDKDYSIQISVEFFTEIVIPNTLLINSSFPLLINSNFAFLIN